MKIRIPFLVAVLAALFLSGAASAQTGARPPLAWHVQAGAASGGSYRLAGLAWQIDGAPAAGGRYMLQPAAPESPALRGNGCCCVFLPCLRK
jgi:hypothetical protein